MRIPRKKVAKTGKQVVQGREQGALRKRMLVVGEGLCVREITDALAEWMDMEVETAENDRIAGILATISLVEDRPYDAVLIDLPASDSSGLAAAQWLRRHGWPGPIVACGDEAREAALESGCDDFIQKPLSSEKIKAAYANVLKQGSEASPAVGPQHESLESKTPARDAANRKPQGRVLVVEDALCMQAIVRAFLEKMDLDADMAENGQLACEMAMQSLTDGCPYDVILMDIQMPKMNGKQATKWLREHDWKGPIIAVSMHRTDKEQATFLAAGCTGCLAKPITLELLSGAISPYVQC